MVRYKLLLSIFVILIIAAVPIKAAAHPLLNTILLLHVHDQHVAAVLEVPLSELDLVLDADLKKPSAELLSKQSWVINSYLADNFKPSSPSGKAWGVTIENPRIKDARVLKTGQQYQKWVVDVTLTPPKGESTRVFNLGYSAVADTITDHLVLVSINQDWASGITSHHPVQVGIIGHDFENKRAERMKINVSQGSLLSGFVGMVKLGMEHIRDGTDHLLFLLTLLLPAPLLWAGRRWGAYAGVRPTFRRIIAITTAFTIGHSITLIIATLARLQISSQPIEALIAVSIIVSAIHAIRPLFPGKEIWIAAGFGLIHGAAFSFTLAELQLNTTQTVISLLGFNIGIELMQLLIVALVMPPLIIFARTKAYPFIRIGGAVIALIAAVGWLFARIGLGNPIGSFADSLSDYGHWAVLALGSAAVIYLLRSLNPEQSDDEAV